MRAHNKLELPKDFAQRILDNEIEFKLTDKPSSQVVCNLIELYSTGLSYYQSIKSYKYLYFKKKMDEIFSQDTKLFKDTKKQQKEAEQQTESPISKKLKSKNQQQRIEALKIKQKQQKMQNEVIQKTKSHQTKKEAQKLIKSIAQKDKILENKIKSTLDKQDQLLQQKLLERKRKSFSKSFSAYGLTEGTETKQSLFLQEPQKKNNNTNQKLFIEPLVVNFQNVIKDDDSDDDKELVYLQKAAIIPKGRIASMGRLKQ